MQFLYYLITLLAAIYLFYLLSLAIRLRPLNENEIIQLANYRRESEIDKHWGFNTDIDYKFLKKFKDYDESIKPKLDPLGAYYDTKIEQAKIPITISELLKGKKHQWFVVFCISKKLGKNFWANKGPNKNEIIEGIKPYQYLNDSIINQYDSVFIFHNHPNDDPSKKNLLSPDESDFVRLKSRFNHQNIKKINLLEFVCERGNYLAYGNSYPDDFFPIQSFIEHVSKSNGQKLLLNFKLHTERINHPKRHKFPKSII